MSLLSDFNKQFKLSLSPYGFIHLRGIRGFGRLLNNEIFQYITYQGVPSCMKGKRAFSMMFGIHTIYSPKLSKGRIQSTAMDYQSFGWIDSSLFERGPFWNVYHYDGNSTEGALNQAFYETIHVAFRHMDEVKDIATYIDYCKIMCPIRLCFSEQLHNDSILLIKESHPDSMDEVRAELEGRREANIQMLASYGITVNQK